VATKPREPSNEFDFQAVEQALEKQTSPPPGEEIARAIIAFESFLDYAIGRRINAKEIATRIVALALFKKHWRFHGMSAAEIARRLGVTKSALLHSKKLLPQALRAKSSQQAFDSQMRTLTLSRGKKGKNSHKLR